MIRTTLGVALAAEHRERLMRLAREVGFPAGARLFEQGQRADRFWILRSGAVVLDLRVPGRHVAVVDRLVHHELVGWAWVLDHRLHSTRTRLLHQYAPFG